MRNPAKSVVQGLLRPLGYEIRRVSASGPNDCGLVPAEKYRMAVNELHGGLSELMFQDLPSREGRRELLAQLVGTPISEAMYILAYLNKSMAADGDVCEFGVAQGATSALMANEIRQTSKQLWLFDSFEGLPAPTEKDILINDIFGLGSIEKYKGQMASPEEMVKSRLADIGFPMSRTRLVRGFIEETVKSSPLPEKVCFAYIDFDFYEPILIALRMLHSRLADDGAIVIDDYGFFSAGAKTAVDEFVAEENGAFELSLPNQFAAESTPFCILRKSRRN
jgi:O-methyltransferase